jgi:hypothetical protein
MPKAKLNPHLRKVPFNASITYQTVHRFEGICEKFVLDKNALIESFIEEFLLGFQNDELKKLRDRGIQKNYR